MRASILVLGVGNPLLGDEGVGPCAIDELERGYVLPQDVRILDGGAPGLSLLGEITRADRLVLLDAVQTGARPGTVVTMEGESLFSGPDCRLSPHQIGLGDVIAAARLQGGPQEVVLFGIEPERMELGLGLSSPVAGALPKLVETVIQQLGRWGVAVRKLRESRTPARPSKDWLKRAWRGRRRRRQ
jgi:hydrogenase maturation protease